MKVVMITSYEDHKYGEGPTAIIRMPEGMTADDVFVRWLQARSEVYAKQPRSKCLEAMYSWREGIVGEVA